MHFDDVWSLTLSASPDCTMSTLVLFPCLLCAASRARKPGSACSCASVGVQEGVPYVATLFIAHLHMQAWKHECRSCDACKERSACSGHVRRQNCKQPHMRQEQMPSCMEPSKASQNADSALQHTS